MFKHRRYCRGKLRCKWNHLESPFFAVFFVPLNSGIKGLFITNSSSIQQRIRFFTPVIVDIFRRTPIQHTLHMLMLIIRIKIKFGGSRDGYMLDRFLSTFILHVKKRLSEKHFLMLCLNYFFSEQQSQLVNLNDYLILCSN